MSKEQKLIIAIDGPAAAGKGTLAKSLAMSLGLPYLDTGLLYRAVARRVLDAQGDVARDAEVHAQHLSPEDILRHDLRVPEVDQGASLVAKNPAVRAALLERQRVFGRERGAVVDGRDIGTVVFPDADAKFYITASPEVRAQRRYQQRYGEVCKDKTLLEVEVSSLMARDRQDASREVSPLKPADDAIEIVTDELDAQAVLEKVQILLRSKGLF